MRNCGPLSLTWEWAVLIIMHSTMVSLTKYYDKTIPTIGVADLQAPLHNRLQSYIITASNDSFSICSIVCIYRMIWHIHSIRHYRNNQFLFANVHAYLCYASCRKRSFTTDVETNYKTKWPPLRLLVIRLRIVSVTILLSMQRMIVIRRDVKGR